jgi:DNA-binding CsgD family transcriptional regulator
MTHEIEELTDKDYLEMWKRARSVAARAGHYEDAEDIASDYIIAKLKGNKTNMSQIIVDYLRNYKGNMRTNKGRAKAEAQKSPIDSAKVIGRDVWNKLVLGEEYLIGLTRTQRVIVKLTYDWGFTRYEVGNVLGISECAITHHLNNIYEIIGSGSGDKEKDNKENRSSKKEPGRSTNKV